MSKSRASFKLAVQYCRQHKQQLQADACAKSCFDKDSKKFWKNISKIANN